METRTRIQSAQRIADLRAQLAAEQARLELLPQFTPAQELADELHAHKCRLNHTDMCGYEYESWDAPQYSKKEYLDKAERILAVTDFDTAIAIIKEV